MIRESLDQFDVLPPAMINYLRHYGRHFNKKLCDFATKRMQSNEDDEKEFKPISKEKVDTILSNYNIKLKNNQLYDYVYVANMCKADFYGSSIEDDKHFALYIKDVIDDVDGYDGLVFNRWYADMCRKGIAIDWEEML